jgi:hypothetical protein
VRGPWWRKTDNEATLGFAQTILSADDSVVARRCQGIKLAKNRWGSAGYYSIIHSNVCLVVLVILGRNVHSITPNRSFGYRNINWLIIKCVIIEERNGMSNHYSPNRWVVPLVHVGHSE